MSQARTDTDLLSTGKAARLLGCSRQHVVDLCDEGKLGCQRIGVHRRVRRADLEAFIGRRPRREQLRSLWLNRVVAGKLAQDPDRVLARARRNLERFQTIHAGATVARWLDEWQRVIAQGPEVVMRTLTSEAPHAADLRQNSPFAGVLSESERRDVLESFTRHWESRAT